MPIFIYPRILPTCCTYCTHYSVPAEEWTISNPSSIAHGWHIHIDSFQVLSMVDMATGRNVLQQAYWADTMYIPPNHR